ncbi:LysR family transcriptional regulator [Fusobacterium polymorphum]|uniref:LysR family transcriptional regulator n=1 Tax=Fusobacterium nucleatum subsp. polymorphum TaxID=76857 RepID=A0A2C6AZB5_FUSNP|nr:LysR family transcriptional regulator [Fusobacterium polymorphum]PHH99575.1 LysR family transcriptional regulator [Fusobacterium polymorphum]PIM75596.1 LysR family transcriptional regulator [Fusobacterium polymorphum]
MTLKSLEYFKKLAELQHFTKAANELHISQPSLSYAISELEKDLGVPLFDRKDKKITLNYYGEAFLSYVNQSLSILDEGLNFVKHIISNPKSKNISMGYIQSLSSSIIPPFIEEFYKNPLNKNIQFSFTQKDNNELIKIFLDRKLDIIFCVDTVKGAISQAIGEQELCFVVSKEHPLCKKENIKLKDLENENFLLINPGTNLRKTIDKNFKRLKFNPKVTLELGQCSNILIYVEKNLGISIVPKVDIIGHPLCDKLQIINVKNLDLKRTIYVNWFPRKNENLTLKYIENFIEDFFLK